MNYTKAKIFNMVLKNLRVSVSIQNANQNDKNTVILTVENSDGKFVIKSKLQKGLALPNINNDVIIYEGGEELVIPVFDTIEDDSTLAPWRRS